MDQHLITREEFLRVATDYFTHRVSIHNQVEMIGIALKRFDDAVKSDDDSLIKNLFDTMKDYITNSTAPSMELI